MAYKTLLQATKALLLEKKGQFVEGFLTAAKTRIGKFKSTIYTFDTKNGPVDVWGSGKMDTVLLDSKGKTVRSDMVGVMVKVTCTDVRTLGKGKAQKTYRDFKVEADFENRQSGKGKTYQLKK